MKWRALLSDSYASVTDGDGTRTPRFYPAVAENELANIERELGLRLPGELRLLFQESNGVMELMHISDMCFDIGWLVWPTHELLASNRRLQTSADDRSHAWPLECLFFVNAGVDGIQFGIDLTRVDSGKHPVFGWWPIDDRTADVAVSLQAFLCAWVRGEVQV